MTFVLWCVRTDPLPQATLASKSSLASILKNIINVALIEHFLVFLSMESSPTRRCNFLIIYNLYVGLI